MKWTTYKSVEEFKKVVMQDLLQDRIQNGLIIRDIERNIKEINNEKIRMGTVTLDGKLLIISLQILPKQMHYAVMQKDNSKALEFFVDNLAKLSWTIDGVMSDEQSSKEFVKLYNQKFKNKLVFLETNIVYKLETLLKIKLPKGKLRKATEKDLYYLPHWRAHWCQEIKSDKFETKVEYQINNVTKYLDTFYVWECSGVPVSVVDIQRTSPTSAKVGGVYTPPHFRRKGYASAAVWHLCNKYKNKFEDFMLYAFADDPAPNRCYQKIGFKEVSRDSIYKISC